MPVTTTTSTVKHMSWDDNPKGASSALIEDSTLTQLEIYEDARLVVYTTDVAMLTHIKNVITDILNELAPPPAP